MRKVLICTVILGTAYWVAISPVSVQAHGTSEAHSHEDSSINDNELGGRIVPLADQVEPDEEDVLKRRQQRRDDMKERRKSASERRKIRRERDNRLDEAFR